MIEHRHNWKTTTSQHARQDAVQTGIKDDKNVSFIVVCFIASVILLTIGFGDAQPPPRPVRNETDYSSKNNPSPSGYKTRFGEPPSTSSYPHAPSQKPYRSIILFLSLYLRGRLILFSFFYLPYHSERQFQSGYIPHFHLVPQAFKLLPEYRYYHLTSADLLT